MYNSIVDSHNYHRLYFNNFFFKKNLMSWNVYTVLCSCLPLFHTLGLALIVDKNFVSPPSLIIKISCCPPLKHVQKVDSPQCAGVIVMFQCKPPFCYFKLCGILYNMVWYTSLVLMFLWKLFISQMTYKQLIRLISFL